MSDIVADLQDQNFRGAMQHLRDWSELDAMHDRAAAEITRLRSEHATAVGRAMTSNAHKNETERLLIAEREETARLRSLVEEAKGVVGPLALLAETLHSLTPDRQARVLVMKRITAARSLLDKLNEG